MLCAMQPGGHCTTLSDPRKRKMTTGSELADNMHARYEPQDG